MWSEFVLVEVVLWCGERGVVWRTWCRGDDVWWCGGRVVVWRTCGGVADVCVCGGRVVGRGGRRGARDAVRHETVGVVCQTPRPTASLRRLYFCLLIFSSTPPLTVAPCAPIPSLIPSL